MKYVIRLYQPSRKQLQGQYATCHSMQTYGSIGSDNGLSPIWRQAIIYTNAGILLIAPLGEKL